jgi:sugar phosphate isomerase/epimerase
LEYIEGTVAGVLCPLADDGEFEKARTAAVAAALPVEAVNCFIPADMKTTGPDVDISRLDTYVLTACKRAAKTRVRVIVFGSGGSRKVPDGLDRLAATRQLVTHLKRWGPIAGMNGLTIVLESLHKGETNLVNTVEEAAAIVREVNHPNVRLIADTYHMATEGESPDVIILNADLLAHVHCAEKAGRGPLGAVGEDHRPYFAALKRAGYKGRISIEANFKDFAAQLPEAVAELRKQIETA